MKYINVDDVLDILNQIEDAQENEENFLSAARTMVEEQSFNPADYNFNEWCHDCKEYDQERHCCPRFNNVIRKTVQECREGYNIIYCEECEYYHNFGNSGKCDYFSIDERNVEILTNPYDWCSGAIRKDGVREDIADLWIPVKERLPNPARETYWVCTDSGYQCECRWTNVNPFWQNLTTDEWYWNFFDIPSHSEVVAWRMLPEPYKEESE